MSKATFNPRPLRRPLRASFATGSGRNENLTSPRRELHLAALLGLAVDQSPNVRKNKDRHIYVYVSNIVSSNNEAYCINCTSYHRQAAKCSWLGRDIGYSLALCAQAQAKAAHLQQVHAIELPACSPKNNLLGCGRFIHAPRSRMFCAHVTTHDHTPLLTRRSSVCSCESKPLATRHACWLAACFSSLESGIALMFAALTSRALGPPMARISMLIK